MINLIQQGNSGDDAFRQDILSYMVWYIDSVKEVYNLYD